MGFSADWLYWLILIGVCAANVVLVYIAWWALFSDRAKGRRRCPRCWYDLAYSPGTTCAECGFTAAREKQLHATRRRYKTAAAAIFCSVALSGYVSDRLSQQGWAAHMPTGWLLAVLPLTDDFNGSVGRELVARASTGQMTRDQWIDLLDRCAAGDWGAAPVSDAWVDKYGWFIGANRQGLRRDVELQDRLRPIPPRLDVKVRPVWPAASNATAMVQLRDWWPWGMECRIRATPRLLGSESNGDVVGATTTFYRSGDDRVPRSDFPLVLPEVRPDTNSVVIDFQIDRRRMKAALPKGEQVSDWEPALTRSVTLPVRAQQPTELSLTPVDSLVMSGALARVFGDSPVRFPSNRSPVRFRMLTSATDISEFDDVALGMTVELLHNDVLARQLNVWRLGGVLNADRHYGFEVAFENPNLAAMTESADQTGWNLRIRGDLDLALRVGAGTKFWNGDLNVPVELTRVNTPVPNRAWWTDDAPPSNE